MDPTIIDSATGLLGNFTDFLHSLLLPSRLIQVGVLVGLFVVAWGLARIGAARLDDWLRTQENMTRSRMRLFVVLRNRMRGVIFVILAWTAVWVIQQITPFPSRRYLVAIFATIATAWVIISFIASLIRNPVLRRTVKYAGWTYVTLHFLGFLEASSAFLDTLSLQLGDFRISALGVLKALVVTGVLFAGARIITRSAQNKSRQTRTSRHHSGCWPSRCCRSCFTGLRSFWG